jgi:NMD protein affecting ribosome stability and mRNA decay
MTSNPNQPDYIECPYCQGLLEPKSGKQKCPECGANLEIDDRLECIFADTNDLRLPVNGTICTECGLVQGEGITQCFNCGAKLSYMTH